MLAVKLEQFNLHFNRHSGLSGVGDYFSSPAVQAPVWIFPVGIHADLSP